MIQLLDMGLNISGIGQRIRRLRDIAQMSQGDLLRAVAEQGVEVNQGHISNIERETRLPSIELLRALSVALDTNTDYLLGLTDDDRPPSHLDDQVVVAVEDAQDRAIVQEIADLVTRASRRDKQYIAELVKRLLVPAFDDMDLMNRVLNEVRRQYGEESWNRLLDMLEAQWSRSSIPAGWRRLRRDSLTQQPKEGG